MHSIPGDLQDVAAGEVVEIGDAVSNLRAEVVERASDSVKALAVDSLATTVSPTAGMKFVHAGINRVIGTQEGSNDILVPMYALSENMEGSSDVIGSIDGTTTDIVQVIKLSSLNIGHVEIMMSASAVPSETQVNACDSLTGWSTSDAIKTPISIDTGLKQEGTGSLKIDIEEHDSDNDRVTLAISPAEDWTAVQSLLFWVRQTSDDIEMRIIIKDGSANEMYHDITIASGGTWYDKEFPLSTFVQDGPGVDPANITAIILEVKDANVDGSVHVDDIRQITSALGTVDVELYDFGATADPTSLSAGTLEHTAVVTLSTTKKQMYDFDVDPIVNITAGDYVGIVVTNRSQSNTTINIYGKNAGNHYSSGKAYSSTDNGTNISQVGAGAADMFFIVFSVVAAKLRQIVVKADDTNTGEARITVLLEDDSEKIIDVLVHDNRMFDGVSHDYEFPDLVEVGLTDKIEVIYRHNGGLESKVFINYDYHYTAVTING